MERERELVAVQDTRAGFELATRDLEIAKLRVEALQEKGFAFSPRVQICITELSAAWESCQSIMREWSTYCPDTTDSDSSTPPSSPTLSSPSPSK